VSGAGWRRALAASASIAAAGAAVQTAPSATCLTPLHAVWPALVGAGRPGRVALTFDDGPDGASTPLFLDLLDDHDVRATFFLLGEMVQRFPDLPRRMVGSGHEVAVHSWDHRNHLRHLPGRRTTEQLERTAEVIERRSGVRPSYFRPPYGSLTGADLWAASRLGLRPVLWTAWGRDWSDRATPASVLRTVTSGKVDGGTVLLHDSDCTSAPGAWLPAYGALPAFFGWCAERGLDVGPLRVVHGTG
jgi:peptidoglycan/xylan/chitin deacetylase (PgdA/CDA1 family)